MKILILTSRFGMGHYCAAEAIKEELRGENSKDSIEVVDIIQALFPRIYKIIYGFFNLFICRFSGIYNCINSYATNQENPFIKEIILNKINYIINKYKPDLIISTWSASSRFISSYKAVYGEKIPLYTYVTDVTVHNGWITEGTDMYFVAAKSTKDMLISEGVPCNKIVINGIPVRKGFKESNNPKKYINKKNILIMGGGLGLIPEINNILDELSEKDIFITVITGKNKKLNNWLKTAYPQLKVVGYTNEVHKYMREADLIITKPGGLSTFEAIYSNTPLCIIKPFLSQEIGNAKFIETMGIGKVLWENETKMAEDIIELINDKALLVKMKYNMELIRSEIGQSKLKDIYERNIKYVDYDYSSCSSSIYNDLWGNSYNPIQTAEYKVKKA